MKDSPVGIYVVMTAVVLIVCLTVVWWSFSTENDGPKREHNPSDRMLAGCDTLMRQQKKSKRSAQTSGGNLNIKKMPVNVVASVATKTAIDAFVVRDQMSSSIDAAS